MDRLATTASDAFMRIMGSESSASTSAAKDRLPKSPRRTLVHDNEENEQTDNNHHGENDDVDDDDIIIIEDDEIYQTVRLSQERRPRLSSQEQGQLPPADIKREEQDTDSDDQHHPRQRQVIEPPVIDNERRARHRARLQQCAAEAEQARATNEVPDFVLRLVQAVANSGVPDRRLERQPGQKVVTYKWTRDMDQDLVILAMIEIASRNSLR